MENKPRMCKDCPHFKILYGPIGKAPDIWDFGRAKCEKHDLYVDFVSKRKLNRLECVEKAKPGESNGA